MRIGMLIGAVLIGLALVFGIVFVAGFPLMARMNGFGAYGGQMMGSGMMPGGLPMQPGQMPRMQPNQRPNVPVPQAPGGTAAPNAPQPPNSSPQSAPGFRQMPMMPYGAMPTVRARGMTTGRGAGGFGGAVLGLWRFALMGIGIMVGAVTFTALGFALGRRAGRLPVPVAAPVEPPAQPENPAT